MSRLKDSLMAFVKQYPIDFGYCDTLQCAEFLYQAYAESRKKNSCEIENLYSALGTYLDSLSIEQSNRLFQIIVSLADQCEKEGFLTGLKFGISLMAETDVAN